MVDLSLIMKVVANNAVSLGGESPVEETPDSFIGLLAPLMASFSDQVEQFSEAFHSSSLDEETQWDGIVEPEDSDQPVTAWFALQNFVPPGEQEEPMVILTGEGEEAAVILDPPVIQEEALVQAEGASSDQVQWQRFINSALVERPPLTQEDILSGRFKEESTVTPSHVTSAQSVKEPFHVENQSLLPSIDVKASAMPSSKDVLHSLVASVVSSEQTLSATGEVSQDSIDTKSVQPWNSTEASLSPAKPSPVLKTVDLPQSVHHKDWGESFTQQIVWLGQQKIKGATLRLNPQELGPIEINIKMGKEGASIHMATHSIQVQDIIEQSLPRLRELFLQQELQLAEVNVEHQETHSEQHSSAAFHSNEGDDVPESERLLETSTSSYVRQGIIDYFA